MAIRSVRCPVPPLRPGPAALYVLAAVLAGAAAAAAAAGGSGYHQQPLSLDANGGLLEYSVVYTDRALNSMSSVFVGVMQDLHKTLCAAYNAKRLVILPGSGSYGMEAVARQVATDKRVLVIRNGYFSYRWTDIFEQTGAPKEETVVRAGPATTESGGRWPHYEPPSLAKVHAEIERTGAEVVFAPHVETSTGIVLPDEYIRNVAEFAHDRGALFVLDGVAAGMQWIDMAALGVDFYITAPQKGWTGPACAGLVLLGERGYEAVSETTSTSMVLNLKKWRDVMEKYLDGGFAYHTTMPTDALQLFRDVAAETERYGFARAKEDFLSMGSRVRAMMEAKGFKSVAAPGYQAPGVVVSYTDDKDLFAKFKARGLQTAAGVPFMLDEAAGTVTFRIGLFGIDKIYDTERTVHKLERALDSILSDHGEL